MKNIIDICNVNISNSLNSLYEASLLDIEGTLSVDKKEITKALEKKIVDGIVSDDKRHQKNSVDMLYDFVMETKPTKANDIHYMEMRVSMWVQFNKSRKSPYDFVFYYRTAVGWYIISIDKFGNPTKYDRLIRPEHIKQYVEFKHDPVYEITTDSLKKILGDVYYIMYMR